MEASDPVLAGRAGCEWSPVHCHDIGAIGGRPGKPLRVGNTRAAAGDQSEEGWRGRVPGLEPDPPISLCSCLLVLWMGGRRWAGQKRCMVQAVFSSVQGCSDWARLQVLLFSVGWGRWRDGWALGHQRFCRVRLNGRRAASFLAWPLEGEVRGWQGARWGAGGFDYGFVKGSDTITWSAYLSQCLLIWRQKSQYFLVHINNNSNQVCLGTST